MGIDALFWAAFQGSLALGLVHGVNPCGHSWLVLAPFVVREKQGGRITLLTAAFLIGTSLACLLLGLTLGAVSAVIPATLQFWVNIGTSALLVVLGSILLLNPDLLHHHHAHDHGHGPAHEQTPPPTQANAARKKLTGLALFGIGFGNMIIPCPTVAMMYGYALDSGSAWKATAIFAIYAVGTALAVSTVIYTIYHVARALEKLAQDWVEHALMRGAGVVTIIFAGYSLFTHWP